MVLTSLTAISNSSGPSDPAVGVWRWRPLCPCHWASRQQVALLVRLWGLCQGHKESCGVFVMVTRMDVGCLRQGHEEGCGVFVKVTRRDVGSLQRSRGGMRGLCQGHEEGCGVFFKVTKRLWGLFQGHKEGCGVCQGHEEGRGVFVKVTRRAVGPLSRSRGGYWWRLLSANVLEPNETM